MLPDYFRVFQAEEIATRKATEFANEVRDKDSVVTINT